MYGKRLIQQRVVDEMQDSVKIDGKSITILQHPKVHHHQMSFSHHFRPVMIGMIIMKSIMN
jgi:hypothetical protein